MNSVRMTAPVDLSTTISTYDGQSKMTFPVSLGADNCWSGSLVSLGAPNWDSAVIATNTGNEVILYSKFDPQALPTIGQSVLITGKPMLLTDWKGYARQEIDWENSQGMIYFGTAVLASMKEGPRAVGNDKLTKGGHNMKRDYTAALFLDANEIIATSTDESVQAAMVLPYLTEQTLYQLRQFISPPNAGFYIKEASVEDALPVEVTYEWSRQIDGGPKVNSVSIAFHISYRR